MKAFEVKVVTRFHSLCQIPYYSCLCRTKETAETYFKMAKERTVSKITNEWNVDKDKDDEFEADFGGYRDYFHLFIQEVETNYEFIEGEWRKGYLSEEEPQQETKVIGE